MGQELEASADSKRTRIELPYLDGLRGLAALYVAIYHAYLFTGYKGDHQSIPIVGYFVRYGFLGVPVFIVLSGYLLMLPLVQNDLNFNGGVISFLRKRARRILPPYYAALVFSLLLILLVPSMQLPSGTQWDSKVPVSMFDIISHLLMVHDFSDEWIGKINGPLWSVAVEWHIYFLMPLLLVPLWRKIGGVATVCVMLVGTLLLAWFDILGFAHPWFIALFAAGMLAAQLSVKAKLSKKMIWGLSTGLILLFIGMRLLLEGTTRNSFAVEVSAGLALALALAAVGGVSIKSATPRALRLLESGPIMKLGLFSYSIYLIHSPLLALGNILTLPLGLSPSGQYLLMTFIVLPVALFVCWLFFVVVERRYLNSRQTKVSAEG